MVFWYSHVFYVNLGSFLSLLLLVCSGWKWALIWTSTLLVSWKLGRNHRVCRHSDIGTLLLPMIGLHHLHLIDLLLNWRSIKLLLLIPNWLLRTRSKINLTRLNPLTYRPNPSLLHFLHMYLPHLFMRHMVGLFLILNKVLFNATLVKSWTLVVSVWNFHTICYYFTCLREYWRLFWLESGFAQASFGFVLEVEEQFACLVLHGVKPIHVGLWPCRLECWNSLFETSGHLLLVHALFLYNLDITTDSFLLDLYSLFLHLLLNHPYLLLDNIHILHLNACTHLHSLLQFRRMTALRLILRLGPPVVGVVLRRMHFYYY